MVKVSIDDGTAVFEVEGFDKVWALRSRLQIPLAHITDVESGRDQVSRWWHGFKIMGADLPGMFAAGTFYYHGELVFWDVHDPTETIIISLDHECYKKLIIQVDDPAETGARLRAAIGKSM
jgi:hypothetical protein